MGEAVPHCKIPTTEISEGHTTPNSSGRHLDSAAALRKNFRKISEKLKPGRTQMTMLRMLPAVLAAAFAFTAGSAQAEIKKEWVEYSHGDMKLKAYMAYDDKVTGKRPAILMIHAREGMTPKTQQLTETWAKLGYVSFAADIFGYGQGILPKDVPEMTVQTTIYSKDRPLMRSRTQAGYDMLIKNPMVDASKVALIGYCFGGAVGVEFGSTGAPLAANVAIHGSFRDHAPGWAKNAKGMF